ncbi:hypothetical protein N7533_010726 [Penicillium manginii]|uniref:uncharacterized protein n=1 Tax=Penicillium manginii TaxID=203109 RepID=UPI002548341B|nr:uncharacterized protein N7533_010726 [Penicillium manginii]KAJ5741317.1 hypothetical protein N7533_010726 [Penicillium manginii]
MGFLKTFAATAVLSALIPNAVALNADSKSNVAVYYGQGAYQPRLSHFCQETSLDIINIGFINVFPKAVGDWPGSNFGNQCDGNVYEDTELLSGCHQIIDDIPICKELGKTVMLSLGGETAYEDIPNDEVAEWFADFLWYSFGPPGQNDTFPRPFLDNQVDGFDFDIEHNGGNGYATMIKRLRSHYADFPDETFYISGAPQCQLPDLQLSDAIANSDFDFIWVQWYNTGSCSATNFLEGNGDFNFVEWAAKIQASANPDAKLFIGLPASEKAAVDGFYMSPEEVYPLVDFYMNLYPDTFGGIMLWEATASDNNTIDGHNYAQHMKHILRECDPSPPPLPTSTIFVTPTPKPTVTSSTPSSPAVQTSSQTPSSAPASSSQPAPSSTYVASSTVSPSSSLASSVTPTISSSSAAHPSTPAASSSSVIGSSSSPATSPSSSLASSVTPTIGSSSVPHSSIPTASSNSVTGSSSSPAASHSASPSPTGESSTQTPVSSHSHPVSSNTPGSEKPSTKPTASETPCSTETVIPTHSGTSSGPASHSSSPSPGKSTHTSGTIKTSVTPSGVSPIETSTSTVSSGHSTTSESLSSTTTGSSSSSASRTASRTITRTPVSSPPSSTGTHLSPSGDSSQSVSLSTTPGSAISSTEVTGVSSDSTLTTGGPSATGVESSTGPESTGNSGESSSGASSTGAQPTGNGGESTTGASSTGAQPTGNGGESTTGAQSTGNGSQSQTGSIITASPSVTTATSVTTPPTITTIIVTSYTDICPTGFTTITTTITTTICPEATAGVTNPPSGSASTTPSIPEGWTTTVKVCGNCAPTPTTVTLTLPNPVQTTEVAVETSPVLVTTETWTTTVTFCKHCGVTGSSVTLTVPYTTVISAATTVVTPGASPEQGELTISGGLPQTTLGNYQAAVPSHRPSSSWSRISGGLHSPSQTPTFKVHVSTTMTVQNPAPTGSGEGVSAEFNAATSQSGLVSLFSVSLAAVLSICLLI